MKQSIFKTIILILSSILFGFLLVLIPSYLNIFDWSTGMMSVLFVCLFVLFFAVVIVMFIHSQYLIRKARFISTLIPLRMYDSLYEDGMMVFYYNLKKLVKYTNKSLIYITYPIDRYNEERNKFNIYSKRYYGTKAGKELKGFHNELLNYVKKMLKADRKMYFRLLIQNISSKPESVSEIEKEHIQEPLTENFLKKINNFKKILKRRVVSNSVIDYYNVLSEKEFIAVISDNSKMLLLTRIMDKYVTSFIKDPAIVKDFVIYTTTKIPEKH